MCGIAGIVSLEADPALRALAAQMGAALCHRGPDGEGVFACPSGKAALAFRRLAIIDLSTGDQPMTDAEGRRTIVFNGEVYNFQELRCRLEGRCTFHTHSDTEALLETLAVQGEAGLSQVRGMFAFALWDRAGQTLLLARDRFGKKPLFYTQQGKRLFFASELKAFAGVLPGLKVDRVALRQYLALGYIPGTRTIHERIRRLAPGHLLRFSSQGLEQRR
jgi:asparagine synthase (glutamine-hydrolysing)